MNRIDDGELFIGNFTFGAMAVCHCIMHACMCCTVICDAGDHSSAGSAAKSRQSKPKRIS